MNLWNPNGDPIPVDVPPGMVEQQKALGWKESQDVKPKKSAKEPKEAHNGRK